HERTGGRDGFVSIEVDPRLAQDPSATVTQAQRLAAAIDRENLMVKIPATQACLPAITEVLAAGISVNVTLMFSLPRVREVVNAWLAGLE
ncbi:transaldolase family protein, partial [Acinetobacter baumannii]